MNVLCVSEGKPEGELTHEKEKEYLGANTIFCGAVVGVLTEAATKPLKRCGIP
jgi:hypothetical protein